MNIKNLILPSKFKFSIELFIGIFLLLLLNADSIKNYLFGEELVPDTSDIITAKIGQLSVNLENLYDGRLAQSFLWALAGCLIYTLIWFISSVVTDIRNDVVLDKYYKHPSNYKRTAYWESIINDKLLLICISVIFLAYIFFFLKIFPKIAEVALRTVDNFSLPYSPLKLAGLVLAAALLVHLLDIARQVFLRAWHYVFS